MAKKVFRIFQSIFEVKTTHISWIRKGLRQGHFINNTYLLLKNLLNISLKDASLLEATKSYETPI
jgi:hypothetical protein